MKSLTFKQRVKQGVNDLFYIWKQEFRNTFRDQGMLIFFVLVPLVYPLIYSFIYTNETLRDVPAVVVDNSRTALSRDYLRRVDATPEVSIVSHCADMEEAKLALRERKAYGIIYLPASFSDDIAQGRQTQVSLYCDMSGLLYYKSMLLANTEVSLDMNAEIKIARAGNTTERQDELTAYPIVYQDVALYNPTNGFAAFLIPAVLMLIIQQTLLLGIGLSAGTAREHNRFRDYILIVVPRLFRLNQIALPGELTLFCLPYLLACIFFSMTASIAIRNRETCMLLFVFTSVPLLFLSGISWPGSAIPPFWKGFSYLFPSTFGINGDVRINSMGATLNEVAFEYRAWWLQTGIYFLTTCLVYRWQIIQSRRHVIEKYRQHKAKKEEASALPSA